jgi:hypothetical protein
MEILIKMPRGADFRRARDAFYQWNKKEHLSTDLLDYVILAGLEGLSGSSASGRNPREQERRGLNLALRTAARNGDLNEVKNALRRGAQINDRGPKSGLTAVDHAEDAGHRGVANYLRSQGGRRASEL